jgi:heat shock protein HtpX
MGQRSFHDEISGNRRSSILLVAILTLIVVALVTSMAYMYDPGALIFVIPISVFFMLTYSYSSYMYGDRVVLSATGARPADEREHLYLRDTVEGVSLAAGIPPPKVYVIPSDEINAFATGRDSEHASVAVTTGLMKVLDRQELEGVIAHEVSHVRNRDVSFMTLVAVLVGLTAILSHIILRTYRFRAITGDRRRGSRERKSGLDVAILAVGVIFAIFAPLLTRMVQFAFSRRREYLADASGAELTRYPDGLADALEKIKEHNRGEMDISEAVSHIFLVDPNKSALDSLYATHPPLDERIKRLRAM